MIRKHQTPFPTTTPRPSVISNGYFNERQIMLVSAWVQCTAITLYARLLDEVL